MQLKRVGLGARYNEDSAGYYGEYGEIMYVGRHMYTSVNDRCGCPARWFPMTITKNCVLGSRNEERAGLVRGTDRRGGVDDRF